MNTPWRIELFGGLQLVQEDRAIFRFQTAKNGILLAYLTYCLPRPVPRDTLADLIWPESDLSAARNSLRVALNSLRRQLEPPDVPPGAVLIADRSHVQLNPTACITDVAEFDAALKREETATTDDERVDVLRQAVSLYRGDYLEGWGETWIYSERTRLCDACLGALKRLVRLAAQKKDYETALVYARRVLTLEPLREGSHRDLMRLYSAMGRPTAALQQYEDLKRLLKQEMQSVPTAATAELVAQISAASEEKSGTVGLDTLPADIAPLLETETSPSSPAEPAPAIGLPAEPRATNVAVDTLVGNIPMQFTRFVGRAREIEQLMEMLRSPSGASTTLAGAVASVTEPDTTDASLRWVTLVGPGGVGKTRLATEVALRLRPLYENRVWFVPLAELSDLRQLPFALANVLRLPRLPDSQPLEQVMDALADQPHLLILDNLEHLPGYEDFVKMLLRQAPTLRCLVTTRQQTEVDGGRTVILSPLPVPGEGRSATDLLRFASVELFLDRAQSVRPDFQVTTGNSVSIAALCDRLEGLPLAIELAAAWSPMLTPTQMLDRLSQRFSLLVSRRKDRTPRHQTLRAALDYSYEMLTPDLQCFFRGLGVFHGGWSLDCIEAVSGSADALDLLTQLQQRSLVQVEEQGAAMRFSLLETLREYADEQLGDDERATSERAHATYFAALAREIAPRLVGADSELWMVALAQEQDNLRAALNTLMEQGERLAALRMAAALWRFWYARGDHAEGFQRLESVLEYTKDENTDPEACAAALEGVARFAASQGDHLRATELLAERLNIVRALPDGPDIDTTLTNLYLVCRDAGDLAEAARYQTERVSRKRAALGTRGTRWDLACALGDLAGVLVALNATDGARPLYDETLVLRQALGDRWGATDTQVSLATLSGGDTRAGLNTLRDMGDTVAIGASYLNLGQMAMDQGDLPVACELFANALTLFREQASTSTGTTYVALTLERLVQVETRQNDSRNARRHHEEALRLRRELSDPDSVNELLSLARE